MSKSNNFEEEIVKKWRTIVDELHCTTRVVHEIERNLEKFGGWSANSIIRALLVDWRGYIAEKATLNILLEHLENCRLNDISNEIRKEFNIVKIPSVEGQQGYVPQTLTTILPQSSARNFSEQNLQPMESKNYVPIQPEYAATTDNASTDCSFSSIIDKITGRRTITQHDWDTRIIVPNENSVVTLKKLPQTNVKNYEVFN